MSYPVRAKFLPARACEFKAWAFAVCVSAFVCLCAPSWARGQQGYEREVDAAAGVELRVRNRTGRVTVTTGDESQKKVFIRATSLGPAVTEKDVEVGRGDCRRRSEAG